jgi:hypothetical protein
MAYGNQELHAQEGGFDLDGNDDLYGWMLNPTDEILPDVASPLPALPIVPEIEPPQEKSHRNSIPKGQGPEGKALMPGKNDDYAFECGRAYNYLKTRNIKLNLTELGRLVRDLVKQCQQEQRQVLKHERDEPRRRPNAYAWIDHNWQFIEDLFMARFP